MSVVVVDPVLHEVVAGDVNPVTGRGEDRDAEVSPGSQGEHRDTKCPTLGEQPQASGRWKLACQGGVQPYVRVGVDDAEGVGADDPHATAARGPQQIILTLLPRPSGLGETSRDHQ